jgi:uncharacterized membrane protein YccC
MTKRFTSEKQFQQFRLFSLGGLIGLVVVISLSLYNLSGLQLLYTWFGFFVLLEAIEQSLGISKYFEE